MYMYTVYVPVAGEMFSHEIVPCSPNLSRLPGVLQCLLPNASVHGQISSQRIYTDVHEILSQTGQRRQ